MISKKLTKKNKRLILVVYFLFINIVFPIIFELTKYSLHLTGVSATFVDFINSIISIIIIVYLAKDVLISDFKRLKEFDIKKILSMLGIYLIIFVTNAIINLILIQFGVEAENEESLKILFGLSKYYFVFLTVIFAPLIEEIVFRTAIFRAIFDDYPRRAYIISAFIFGLMHVIASSEAINYLSIFVYMNMGFWLAYAYHKYDNIYASMLVHFLNNLIAVIIYFVSY